MSLRAFDDFQPSKLGELIRRLPASVMVVESPDEVLARDRPRSSSGNQDILELPKRTWSFDHYHFTATILGLDLDEIV